PEVGDLEAEEARALADALGEVGAAVARDVGGVLEELPGAEGADDGGIGTRDSELADDDVAETGRGGGRVTVGRDDAFGVEAREDGGLRGAGLVLAAEFEPEMRGLLAEDGAAGGRALDADGGGAFGRDEAPALAALFTLERGGVDDDALAAGALEGDA